MSGIAGMGPQEASVWSTAAGAAEGFKVVRSGGSRFYLAIITNETAATIYAQLHNLAAEPGAGVASLAQVKLLAGEQGSIDMASLLPRGLALGTGLTIAASSVSRTYTAVATAMTMTVVYDPL